MDLREVSPAMCMHPKLLEDGAKPSWAAQHCLKLGMMEVVQKEVIKSFDADVIYPISDTKWVSLVHLVPKNGCITT